MKTRHLIHLSAIVACLLGTLPSGAAPAQQALDHSMVPGVVIDYSPASTRRYLGGPGIAILPNGDYIATHSFFGPGSTQSRMDVHRSRDCGKSWELLTRVEGQWWSSLFFHRGALYLMGTSGSYGSAVIRRSTDGGRTWTTPKDAQTGVLHGDAKYHSAPVPVVVHEGRIWRAMEDAMGPDGWGSHFRAFMMSAPAGADLLEAKSWTSSDRLGRDPVWLGGAFNGWLEGNAVVTPAGGIVDFLRVDTEQGGKATIIRISKDGKRATFDPERDFIDFPGGAKKFTIRFDPRTKLYWSLTNVVQDQDRAGHGKASMIRNTQALVCSPDLRKWEVRSIVLHHPDTAKHAFQYVDWLFEGEDLIAVSRTAYDDGVGGAHRQHDANYITFHRIPRFRERTRGDPPLNRPER